MGKCQFNHFTRHGVLKDYTCDDIESLKLEYRIMNRTDDVLKSRRDIPYEKFCQQIDSLCKCKKVEE